MSIESWRWVLGKKTGEESYTHSSGTQLTSLNHENKRTNKTNEQTNNSSSSINQHFTNITLALFFRTVHKFWINCQHVHVNEALAHTENTNTLHLLHTDIHPKVSILIRDRRWIALWERLFQGSFFWTVRTKSKHYETKWNEKEISLMKCHYLWWKREEEERVETDMMRMWRMGSWVMARRKVRKREKRDWTWFCVLVTQQIVWFKKTTGRGSG